MIKSEKPRSMHSKEKKLWIVFAISTIILGFSRVYVMAHTYNQVISGLVYGFALHYLLCYVYYDDILSLVRKLYKDTRNEQA